MTALPKLEPRIKVITLLNEGYRYEISRIIECAKQGRLSRLHRDAALYDVKRAYMNLLREFYTKVEKEKPNDPVSKIMEREVICTSATKRFAELHPWSDSIMGDVPVQLSSLGRLYERGLTGKLLIMSFGGTTELGAAKRGEAQNIMKKRISDWDAKMNFDGTVES